MFCRTPVEGVSMKSQHSLHDYRTIIREWRLYLVINYKSQIRNCYELWNGPGHA